jgi:DNA-binding NarL/FixJ family response regulator
MSKHGEALEVAILPAGGRARQVVARAIGKRRAHIRVHSLCDFEEAGAPSLVLIDGTALRGGESSLVELIAKLQQSAWRDAPVVVLDDPDAEVLRGFATGYVARIRLDSNPEAIMQLVDRVLRAAV